MECTNISMKCSLPPINNPTDKSYGVSSMHILSAENISKSFGTAPLFQAVSFGIAAGEKIGLIGSNGSGKSTLAAILAGTETPDSGEIITARGLSVHLLPQDPAFDQRGTIIQEVFRGGDAALQALFNYHKLLAESDGQDKNARQLSQLNLELDRLNAWQLEANAKAALTRLGINAFDRNIGSLSGGERKRVALARALITPCDLLVLDEPTNHLDSSAINWLEDFLQKRVGALLFISHDRWLLNSVAQRIMEISQGEFLDCKGGYQHYLEVSDARAEAEHASWRKHRAALRRELNWMLQGAQGRASKEKARKKMFRTLNQQTAKPEKSRLEIDLPGSRMGKKIIELKDLTLSRGGKTLVRDFSYTLLPRDRIGIAGPNGSGKSTLLDAIAGLRAPESGTVTHGETIKIGYYRQQDMELDENLRVLEYAGGIRQTVTTATGEKVSVGKMLEQFMFYGSQQWSRICDLSGGEKQRLVLLGILLEQPNVLLLDEPTNDLDIDTLTVLEYFIADFPGAVISVSHDRWFMDKTAEFLFHLDGQGNITQHNISFSQLVSQMQDEDQAESRQQNSGPRKPRPKTKLSYREQQEYSRLEEEIEQLQQLVEGLEMQQTEAGSDFLLLDKLHREYTEAEEELEQKMQRWLELDELKTHLKEK